MLVLRDRPCGVGWVRIRMRVRARVGVLSLLWLVGCGWDEGLGWGGVKDTDRGKDQSKG